ncbi:agamous-like MADS-box protein AGL19 [Tripterygium wilfordii]|uniref:Agamous-like MADS-box protein AGL19 n=1 Tax=Tripterygium wilfordii TaxID=458696 RepID=A0A7J7DPC0_TRIWF|nr:floral homeotic protein AGAMOUS-like [Tripterygium wilfordii]KAF5748198.1 agamous-like MADS-box protein AGL19 [Tripterygium wilfordii]
MGRGKLCMERISNDKSRMLTYQKRKKGLMKKAYEFGTLCGVDVCVIIHGPMLEDHHAEVETWPKNPNEVKGIIDKYRSVEDEDLRGKKTQDLSDFFDIRRKKVEDEIAKLQLANMESKFPKWDDRLDRYSLDHLRVLEAVFEAKLEAANSRLLMLKSENLFIEDYNRPRTLLGGSNNLQLSLIRPPQQQSIVPYVKPLDLQLPSYYQSDYQAPRFSDSNDNCSMMMLLMEGEELDEFGGCSTSGGYIPYAPSNTSSAYYDHNSATEINNVMFNTPMPLSTGYYDPEANQHMLPYHQHLTMNSGSSQFQPSQFSDFCNVNAYEMEMDDQQQKF